MKPSNLMVVLVTNERHMRCISHCVVINTREIHDTVLGLCELESVKENCCVVLRD